ncbi:hypothetical protein M885DRAFT_615048 [Pelagophyceae sp. CCMP2097]|nr:hypothetical protein M885DRAFT_615048 [Pelagophyceae sp. CCMP2097]
MDAEARYHTVQLDFQSQAQDELPGAAPTPRRAAASGSASDAAAAGCAAFRCGRYAAAAAAFAAALATQPEDALLLAKRAACFEALAKQQCGRERFESIKAGLHEARRAARAARGRAETHAAVAALARMAAEHVRSYDASHGTAGGAPADSGSDGASSPRLGRMYNEECERACRAALALDARVSERELLQELRDDASYDMAAPPAPGGLWAGDGDLRDRASGARFKARAGTFLRRREAARAERVYTTALSFDALDAALHAGRADARLLVGDAAGALRDAEAAVRLRGDSARGHAALAAALRELGRYGASAAAADAGLEAAANEAHLPEFAALRLVQRSSARDAREPPEVQRELLRLRLEQRSQARLAGLVDAFARRADAAVAQPAAVALLTESEVRKTARRHVRLDEPPRPPLPIISLMRPPCGDDDADTIDMETVAETAETPPPSAPRMLASPTRDVDIETNAYEGPETPERRPSAEL